MVTRRTRNFREKSTTMNIFGRLVMPVAVIMALALFYFSIKLFFFAPSDDETPSFPKTETPAITEPYDNNVDDYGELPPEEISDPATVTPVEPAPPVVEEPRPARPAEKPKPAATKPAEKPKPAVSQPAPSASKPRWDVQIGGFKARSGAELTARQAREKGYSAYIVEDRLDGQPFYKVRVRGYAQRGDTQALSKKLEAAGFPVYVVSIK